MAKYFRRDKYQINILSRDFFKKWIEENPKFKGKVDYAKFKRYWRYFRNEFYDELIRNSDGIDLPFFMGNISIKILDINFKCEKDFPTTIRTAPNGDKIRKPFISIEDPKRGKIVWKKNRNFKKIPSYLGMESTKSLKHKVGSSIRNRTQYYQKMAKVKEVPSKCIGELKPIITFEDI